MNLKCDGLVSNFASQRINVYRYGKEADIWLKDHLGVNHDGRPKPGMPIYVDVEFDTVEVELHSLPGVGLVTRTMLGVINWCF